MTSALSAYLDVVRFLAALMVFAHHASYPRFDGGWISVLGGYGHESVVVFFVLSGFVIAFSHKSKDLTPQQYAASRLSRLWSVAVPTIILTLLLDVVGRNLSPQTYIGLCESSATELAASTLFLNELWFSEGCLGTNIPYWSLSYEFLYYCLFAVFAFAKHRWFFLGLAALLVGPKVLLLLPCWAIGAVAFHRGGQPLARQTAFLLATGALVLFVVMVYFKLGNKFVTWRVEALIGPLWSQRLGHSTAFISDNLLGALFAAHLIGMTSLLRTVPVAKASLFRLQKIANSTFAIYLIHYPCLIFLTAVSIRLSGVVNGALVGIGSLAVPILLTPITEKFKRRIRQVLLALLGQSEQGRVGTEMSRMTGSGQAICKE